MRSQDPIAYSLHTGNHALALGGSQSVMGAHLINHDPPIYTYGCAQLVLGGYQQLMINSICRDIWY